MPAYVLSTLLQILSVINFFFAIFIIFRGRRNPTGTWAWLMVVIGIPYFGFIIYLLLGLDGRKYRTFSDKAKNDDKLFKRLLRESFNGLSFMKEQKNKITRKDIIEIEGANTLNDLVYLNFSKGYGSFSSNNDINVFHEGNTKFDSLLRDIKNARSFVHLLYYIINDDGLGNEIIRVLAERASCGVDVKLLVDGMGSHSAGKKFYKPLIEAGGEVAIFMPPRFIRLNYRNHRKIAVIDGLTGYVGGLNIGDEYLGKVKRFGFWRDSHIRIYGDAVKNLEVRFLMDWCFVVKRHMNFTEKYFPEYKPLQKSEFHLPTAENCPMQIVSSGPDTKWRYIHYGYIKMITEADKSVYIQTPYFAPDDSVFEALKIAALSGIDVRIIIPGKPDHMFVYWASLSYLGELLEAGVKCYQYEDGFIHSKLVLVDGFMTAVGTANMDMRSFKLNFEINAFVYDSTITKAFEERFFEDLKSCVEIDDKWYSNRSTVTKIKESVSRLLSPLL